MISSLRDTVRCPLGSVSEQMRTKRKEAMAMECLKLKVSLSLPWSLLQMVVWEKNAFGFTKDQQRWLQINEMPQFQLLQTILELWYASSYWDPQSDAWEVWEVQDIHIQKPMVSKSIQWLKLIKWKYMI